MFITPLSPALATDALRITPSQGHTNGYLMDEQDEIAVL